jgi:hypothetical protein
VFASRKSEKLLGAVLQEDQGSSDADDAECVGRLFGQKGFDAGEGHSRISVVGFDQGYLQLLSAETDPSINKSFNECERHSETCSLFPPA